ncbi:hypothetical protein [Streptomyces sp. NPDC006552]|uniref:hypothetical protein n=1 Tax=Streptomyces sp. NPDC006552 TaxID=3157179 RepID=UPI0033AD3981
MAWTRRPALAGLTMVLVAALAACGGGGGGADREPSGHAGAAKGSGAHAGRPDGRPRTVAGVRDAVRHVTRQTARSTRPHLVRTCASESRKVRHTGRSKGRTRTWYTTEKHQDCTKVRRGTETYTRVVRPERWCVRLDDVNGEPRTDDVWYRVRRDAYTKVDEADARAKVTVEPVARGC